MFRLPLVTRRTFLTASAAAVGGALISPRIAGPDGSVRIGLIGLGRRGLRHLATLSLMPDVVVTALCDRCTARVRAAKDAFDASTRGARCYLDPGELIRIVGCRRGRCCDRRFVARAARLARWRGGKTRLRREPVGSQPWGRPGSRSRFRTASRPCVGGRASLRRASR